MSQPERPTGRQLLELRTATENLTSSTLTLVQLLREQGVELPARIRNQMTLVICDGGAADLALDAAFPHVTPAELLEGRQELRRGLIDATFANTASPDEAARLLTAPPGDSAVSIELGDLALARITADPASADRLADLLDEQTGVSSRDEAVIA